MNEFEALIEQLGDMIEGAWQLPMSRGKIVLDKDEVMRVLNGLRTHYPTEISRANSLLADRDKTLTKARTDAERVLKEAQTRAAQLLNEQEIVIEARRVAEAALTKANDESETIRRQAVEFADMVLKRAEDHYDQNLAIIRQARRVVGEQR